MKSIVILLSFISSVCFADESSALLNCNMTKTVEMVSSDEEYWNSNYTLTSPLAFEFPHNYTGCQTIWAAHIFADEEHYTLIKIVETLLIKGEVVRISGFAPNLKTKKEVLTCKYSQNKLLEKNEQCLNEITRCTGHSCRVPISHEQMKEFHNNMTTLARSFLVKEPLQK